VSNRNTLPLSDEESRYTPISSRYHHQCNRCRWTPYTRQCTERRSPHRCRYFSRCTRKAPWRYRHRCIYQLTQDHARTRRHRTTYHGYACRKPLYRLLPSDMKHSITYIVGIYLLIISVFIGGYIAGSRTPETQSRQVFIVCKDEKLQIQKPENIEIFWNKKHVSQESINTISCK